jgi:hypothetical protein
MSNKNDGCPRVVTEILMTGTPLILSEQTRLLPYYKKNGVIEVNDSNISDKIREGIKYYARYKQEVLKTIKTTLSFDEICQKNIDIWKNVSS